jgi:hypothetical protein
VKKREMFLQAEPYLTMSDFMAVEKNIKDMNERHQILEEKYDNLMKYLEKNNIKPILDRSIRRDMESK